MSNRTGFNLALLRSLGNQLRNASSGTWLDQLKISRRSFLRISAAASAGAAVPRILHGDGFSVVHDDARIHVLRHGEPRWTIDPVDFGPLAKVSLIRYADRITISLLNAVLPGTSFPAGFEAILERVAGSWLFKLEMDCGIQVQAPLLGWLDSQVAARGTWRPGVMRPLPGFALAYRTAPRVGFSQDWTFELEGHASASLSVLRRRIDTRSLRISVNPAAQIAAGHSAPKTQFLLQRGTNTWRIPLQRESEQGWSMSHDDGQETFDELLVEAMENSDGSAIPIHTGMLSQLPGNNSTLKFFTGGGLVSDTAAPFHLPLSKPRIAFALRGTPARSVLVAELNREPLWAHGEHASYLFGATNAAPLLELHDQGAKDAVPDLQPGLCAVCFPDDAVATNLKFPEPKPFRLTWAGITELFESLMGALHLSPSRHAFDAFFNDSPDPEHLLEMERPQDMLALKFQFKNMWLSTGTNPVIRLRDKTLDGQITVIFPPQHVAEEAFFHTDDPPALNIAVPIGDVEVRQILGLDADAPLTDALRNQAKKAVEGDYQVPPKPTGPDSAVPQTRLSEPTRLVFTVPKGDTKIPFHLEDLLNWKEWTPQIVPAAHTGVRIDNYDKLPSIIDPGTDYTSIELPYRVKLSPSDLGRWAHSRKPAKYETGATELWHTRLAVAKLTDKGLPTGKLDEDNTKDRIARAIWSLDYVPVNRTCSIDPHAPQCPPHFSGPTAADPFRMSLDAGDRCELVHLTSNYQIPKPSSVCINKPINDQLLPPAPVSIENLILTSVGGYLKSIGVWDPAKIDANHQLTVEQWRHIATLGRDQYVRVVYKGYLLPFGHRACLVKVTERKFAPSANAQNGIVAILHQRMFIVVHDPIKDYPVMGQPNGARQFPFKRVEAITLVTPDIDPPGGAWPADSSQSQTQSLFWPLVNKAPFQFHFRFTDSAGGVSDASLPVVFADAAVSQATSRASSSATGKFFAGDAVTLYNGGSAAGADDDPWTSTDFSNQKMSLAPAAKPGDTQYDAGVLAFQTIGLACNQNPLDMYANDLPYFYPLVQYARISSSSIKRVTNNNNPTRVVFFQDYLKFGFDQKNNRGEVFLQAHDKNILTLGFGKTTSVDKAGGLSNPDVAVAGFSRKSGPVGGRPTAAPDNKPPANPPSPSSSLSTYSSGNFNPADFFGGLTSAKILGGIRLADIIAPLLPGIASNLGKAPQMLEQSVFALETAIPTIVETIQDIQSWTPPPLPPPAPGQPPVTLSNPLATHLAPQAQRVYDAQGAVAAAHARTVADEGDQVLVLADTLIEADADREFVAAVTDYISALEAAVSNPAALAEEVLVDLFTQLLNDAISSSGLSFETQFAQLLATLQSNLSDSFNSASTPFNQAIATLENFAAVTAKQTISDEVRIIRDNITDSGAQQKAVLLFNEYAPDLAAISNVINAAKDIEAQVNGFPKTVSLGAIPGFFDSVGSILDDLLQIYQSAGFLGVISANPAVVAEIKSAETTIGNLWTAIDYLGNNTAAIAQITSNLVTLENNVLKLAAKSEADVAKQLLQNLRQVQRGVASLDAYRPQLGGHTTKLTDIRRLIQLLQKIQRQILSSLAALQNLIQGTGNNLIAVAQVTNVDLTALGQLLTGLATSLTVADTLIGTGAAQPVEQQISSSFASATPVGGAGSAAVGDTLASPLQAKVDAVQAQLYAVRTKLATSANDLGLKLLHYDLSLQIQDSFAAALEWSVLEPLADFTAVLDTLTNLNAQLVTVATTVSAAVGSALCSGQKSPATVWAAFIKTISDSNAPETEVVLYNLFKVSIDNVTNAFANFCAAVAPASHTVPRPSLVLTRGQQLFASFKALLNDVRTRITGLSALPQELLNQLVAYAENQLATVISELPIPTSITLSYDWHPEIQPFEPVFLLDDGADFTVSANATIPVLNPGAASVDINAELTNFSINLIGSPSFIIVSFDSVKFTSHNGSSPNCQVAINTVTFGEDMSFVKSLADALNPSKGPFIELLDGAIVAGYRFAIDSIPSAGMTVMNLAIEVAVALPFNGDPVRCQFGISDQQEPFLLSFGIYGGGGFLQLQLGLDGVQLLQGALEFGLVADISIGPLQGSGFVVGGIYFRIAGSNSSVCGFVHSHGHMDIFGIISMDVDVYVSVCYDNGSVIGTAEFTVEVSILFFSESFSLEATYTFAGSGSSGGDEQGFLLAPGSPAQSPELSRAVFLVSPDDPASVPPESSPKDPVFVTKDAWKNYLSCFDLAS